MFEYHGITKSAAELMIAPNAAVIPIAHNMANNLEPIAIASSMTIFSAIAKF